MSLRIVLCAREGTATAWARALSEALTQRGLAADVWARNAASTTADPHAPAADIAVVWRPPGALFIEQPRLQAVFNLGAGVDALLALPELPPRLPVVRLEDAGMARSMSDYVLAAVLRSYRRFDRYARAQAERRWQPEHLPPRDTFTIGVLGLGVIGAAIAATLLHHGFAVRGHALAPRTLPGVHCFAGPAEFDAFLAGLDVLVAVLPATRETDALLDRAALAKLAAGAHVVNVGRGNVLVDADLLALLDEGHLSGATLDVFAEEPLPHDHPFWGRSDILVTPHVAAETERDPAVAQVADKLVAWSRGESVSGLVDRERGY